MSRITLCCCLAGLLTAVTATTSFAQVPKSTIKAPVNTPLDNALERKELHVDERPTKPAGQPQPGDIMVNCSLPNGPHSSIHAALAILDPTRVNTLRVSGTCNENVTVQSFENLTLIANPGASINDPSGGNLDVLDVADTHEFSLQGFTINGGAIGIACFAHSLCRFSGNTIQGSAGDGIFIVRARASLGGDTIRNNAGRGLGVVNGSIAQAIGVTIQGNAAQGVVVNSHSWLVAQNLTSQNNGGAGMRLVNHSTLRLIDSTLTANLFGVRADSSSEASFETFTTGNVITGNFNPGVLLGDLSFANFLGTDNITGNNVANPGGLDVFCAPQFSATRGALTNIGGGTTNCLEP